MGRLSTAAVAIVSLLGAGAAGAQLPTPLGAEIHVNLFTFGAQNDSSVARDADGDFVVVWVGTNDGDEEGVFARRFSSLGTPLATEVQVNTYTLGDQRSPAVAMSDLGAFVVTWNSAHDGSSVGVFGRRFSAAGVALAAEFQVNTYTTGLQSEPAIASEGDGDFIVVWQGPGTSDTYGVFGRRFTSSGTPQATEFRVNTTVAGNQSASAIDLAADGRFVVAWQSLGDGSVYGIFAQRFSSSGGVVGPEFQVNDYVTDSQSLAVVGVDDDGDFVVAWESFVQDFATPGIFARRFDSAGTPTGVELQVNTYVTGSQIRPAIAIDGDGDFVVAWAGSDADSGGVFVRRFKSPAVPTTGEIQVNTYVTGAQFRPALAGGQNGDFVVTWSSAHDLDNGIFAQRFDVPTGIDVDGDGQYLPLTDGLLLLRFGFGFSGATLINGVVGPGCTRCDAPTITAHLQSLL